MRERTLNDHVNDVHGALWTNFAYRRLLEAVDDADALEGSLYCDTVMAAQMIRAYAREHGIEHVRDKKLATVVRALNVVMQFHGIKRGDDPAPVEE